MTDNPHVEHKTFTTIDYAVSGKDKRRRKLPVMNYEFGKQLIGRGSTPHLRVVKRLRTVTTITITAIQEWEDAE